MEGKPRDIILVHFDRITDDIEQVKFVVDWLGTVPRTSVLSVPNGSPCPTNPLPKITICNAGNKALLSVIEKINSQAKPGAIVLLTDEEWRVWQESQKDMVQL